MTSSNIKKHKVNKDIYRILKESGIPSEYWEKVLGKLTNYAYGISISKQDNGESDGIK